MDTKALVRKMQAKIDLLTKINEHHSQREEWYLEMLHQFVHEMTELGLSTHSKTCKEIECIYSSNPECSVQDYLEAKRQGGK